MWGWGVSSLQLELQNERISHSYRKYNYKWYLGKCMRKQRMQSPDVFSIEEGDLCSKQ